MQLELFKKTGSYIDKDNKEKRSVQFYVKANETLIPIEPTYYRKRDENGNELQDYGYATRKFALETFATELPKQE